MIDVLQQRNDAFRAFLGSLNAAQRRAVELTEGPVLVVAGPGTGKTHVLAARIGKILLDTDARAQNVLCLTFTDAGANAMRRRLLERIGPEAHRVPIFTFHAFCNRVIQDNAEHFGKGNLEPLTELERIEIVRNLLVKIPPEHPLREGRKELFQYEAHLRDLFSMMKKEGWTPGYVLKKTDEFLNELPANPDFIYKKNNKYGKKGEPKTALVADITQKLKRLKAAADLYPKYQSALERAGRYEYEDMLLWVVRAFEKNEALLRSYQERYQYILVDEFQDTNGAQFHLLNQLLDFWEIPNIFIVGDDDQSIFEFQGARLENLREFYKKYRKGLEVIVLEDNYRSVQDILDAAGRVIENNTLRVLNLFEEPLEKALRAAPSHPHQAEGDALYSGSSGQATKEYSSAPEHFELRAPLPRGRAGGSCSIYPTRLHEITGIASQIETLIQNGVPASEIAVLYARHRQVRRLHTLLEKKGIPCQSKRPVNILEIPLVQQFRELLTWLYEESALPFSGDYRLFRLLHAPWFGLDPLDLAKIAIACNQALSDAPEDGRYEKAGKSRKKGLPWREVLNDPAFLSRLRIGHPEAIAETAQRLNALISDVHNLSLPHLIERLYTRTGLLAWALEQPDKVLYLQALNTFLDFVEEEASKALPGPPAGGSLASHPSTHGEQWRAPFSPPWGGRGGLPHLLDLLSSMDDNKLALPLQQPAQSNAGVQLLTAHAAKGLEFEHVFLFDCTGDAWEKGNGGNQGRFSLPPTLTHSGEEDAQEARRRLFYVAMTRAKRRLQISYSRSDEAGKLLTQSLFADETGLPQIDTAVPQSLLLETQALLLLEPASPVITLPEAAMLDELLANFSLSITAFNRYLRCPLAFYYEDLLKIPGTTSEAAAFGNAMHGALQQFLLKMKSDKKMQWPAPESLLRYFSHDMERQRGWFSEHGFVQRLALGKDYLRRICVEQVPFWRKRAIAERRIDRVELDGAPLTGVVDKIEWLDNGTLRIVDYKTGAPDPKKTAAPDEKQPQGGDYWRQLAFYKILLENARIYPEPVGKTAISWLEPDRRGAFPIVEIAFSREETLFVENLIRDVYAKIRNREFTAGCGKEDCAWCRMHRDRTAAEVFERGEEEGLDDV